jgi:hypothetical protein
MLSVGCVPPILAQFADTDSASYDPWTGCLKELNELSVHHDTMLQESVEMIRASHPDVDVAYADFFSPVMAMVESPGEYGQDSVLAATRCMLASTYSSDLSICMAGRSHCRNLLQGSTRMFLTPVVEGWGATTT